MRLASAVILLTLAIAAPAHAATCNVRVDVTDTDPKGLNVRATPQGEVIAVLKNSGDWIEVHVTGQSGDWFEIDRAFQVDNNLPDGEKPIFAGNGFVHKSTLGLSGLQSGAAIYADHDVHGTVLVGHAQGDREAQFLGCWRDFYRVHVEKATGWTKAVCTNQNTTCA